MSNISTRVVLGNWQAADQLPPTPGVYIIANKINGKVYIGSSLNMERRQKQHLSSLQKGKHSSSRLQLEWNKYGCSWFLFYICEEINDVSLLLEREQFYLDEYKPYEEGIGFNSSMVARSPYRKRLSAKPTNTSHVHDKATSDELLEIVLGGSNFYYEQFMNDFMQEILLGGT